MGWMFIMDWIVFVAAAAGTFLFTAMLAASWFLHMHRPAAARRSGFADELLFTALIAMPLAICAPVAFGMAEKLF